MLIPSVCGAATDFSTRAANMVEIKQVKVNSGEDKLRILIDAAKEVDYETKVLTNPQRIVVDLHNAWIDNEEKKDMTLDSRFAKKLRVAQFNANTVRVVVETNVGKNNYDVFGIEGGGSSYQVVMDFGNLNMGATKGSTIDFSGKTIEDKKEKDALKAGQEAKKESEKQDENRKFVKQDPEDNTPVPVIVEPTISPGISGKIICLDPGHGGSDAGAIGEGGVTEKSITLRVANKVSDLLEKSGAKVIMTRTRDIEVSSKGIDATDVEELKARCDIANKAKADLFISIHMDSYVDSTPTGTTGYYYASGMKASQKLAKSVADGVSKELKTINRGHKSCNFYVVKHTDMPATLLEMAFISNPKEEKLMKSDKGVEAAANGIFEGICTFFGEKKVDK